MLTNQERIRRQRDRLIYAEHNRRVQKNQDGLFVRQSPGVILGNTIWYSHVETGPRQFTPAEFDELFSRRTATSTAPYDDGTYLHRTLYVYPDESNNIMVQVYNNDDRILYDAVDSGYDVSQLVNTNVRDDSDIRFNHNGFTVEFIITDYIILQYYSATGELLRTLEISSTNTGITNSGDSNNKLNNHYTLVQDNTSYDITIHRFNFLTTAYDTFNITNVRQAYITTRTVGNHYTLVYIGTDDKYHLSIIYKDSSVVTEIVSTEYYIDSIRFDSYNNTGMYYTYDNLTDQMYSVYFIDNDVSFVKTIDFTSYVLNRNYSLDNFSITQEQKYYIYFQDLINANITKYFFVDWTPTTPVITDSFTYDPSGTELTDYSGYVFQTAYPPDDDFYDGIQNWQNTFPLFTYIVFSTTYSNSLIYRFDDERDVRIGFYTFDASGVVYEFPKVNVYSYWAFSGNTIGLLTYTLEGIASFTTISPTGTASGFLLDVSNNLLTNDLSGGDLSGGIVLGQAGEIFALKDYFVVTFSDLSNAAGYFMVYDKSAQSVYNGLIEGVTSEYFITTGRSDLMIYENLMFFKLNGTSNISVFDLTSITTHDDISGSIYPTYLQESPFHVVFNSTTRHIAYWVPDTGYTIYEPINNTDYDSVRHLEYKNCYLQIRRFDEVDINFDLVGYDSLAIFIAYNPTTGLVSVEELEIADLRYDSWYGSEKGLHIRFETLGGSSVSMYNFDAATGAISNVLDGVNGDFDFLTNSYTTYIIQD